MGHSSRLSQEFLDTRKTGSITEVDVVKGLDGGATRLAKCSVLFKTSLGAALFVREPGFCGFALGSRACAVVEASAARINTLDDPARAEAETGHGITARLIELELTGDQSVVGR